MTEKRTKKRKSRPASELRDQTIRNMSAAGQTQGQIAEALGIARSTVNSVMTSDETKELVKLGQERLKLLMTLAIDTLQSTMENRNEFGYANAARQTAEGILKSLGVMQTNVNLNHSFPKPTVIEKLEGGQIIMGSIGDGGEEE